jgi:hypothetical protein
MNNEQCTMNNEQRLNAVNECAVDRGLYSETIMKRKT